MTTTDTRKITHVTQKMQSGKTQRFKETPKNKKSFSFERMLGTSHSNSCEK